MPKRAPLGDVGKKELSLLSAAFLGFVTGLGMLVASWLYGIRTRQLQVRPVQVPHRNTSAILCAFLPLDANTPRLPPPLPDPSGALRSCCTRRSFASAFWKSR